MLDRFLRRKAKKPADSFNDRFRSMETKNQESTFSNLLERAMSVVVAAVIVAVLAYTITHTDPETVYATANTLRGRKAKVGVMILVQILPEVL
uniref:CNNM transmembrane domain-containing protein n=1 Tax=Steinernema glaseri TaxID=37863 RepID=A0A1I7ZP74_9BILA